MEELTRKRRGRPPKSLAVSKAAGETAREPAIHDGDGEAGAVGPAAQGVFEGPAAGGDWLSAEGLKIKREFESALYSKVSAFSYPAAARENEWMVFVAQVKEYIAHKGNGYVLAASHPEPVSDSIEGEYVVPVKTGQRGVVNIHGHLLSI